MYQAGETLENDTDWTRFSSTSKGFCFFDDDVPPEDRMEYLTGVVDMRICCIFEPAGPVEMRKGSGRYRDADKDTIENILSGGEIPMTRRKEYSMERYNDKILKLVAVGDCDAWGHKIKWREK